MLSPHMFLMWFALKTLQPKVVIESGVWLGQGTWFVEKACPDARICCLDPACGPLKAPTQGGAKPRRALPQHFRCREHRRATALLSRAVRHRDACRRVGPARVGPGRVRRSICSRSASRARASRDVTVLCGTSIASARWSVI